MINNVEKAVEVLESKNSSFKKYNETKSKEVNILKVKEAVRQQQKQLTR